MPVASESVPRQVAARQAQQLELEPQVQPEPLAPEPLARWPDASEPPSPLLP